MCQYGMEKVWFDCTFQRTTSKLESCVDKHKRIFWARELYLTLKESSGALGSRARSLLVWLKINHELLIVKVLDSLIRNFVIIGCLTGIIIITKLTKRSEFIHRISTIKYRRCWKVSWFSLRGFLIKWNVFMSVSDMMITLTTEEIWYAIWNLIKNFFVFLLYINCISYNGSSSSTVVKIRR